MKQYTVVVGDTLEQISRKNYGVETEANLILSANAGLAEPLSPGAVIVIPDQPGIEEVSPPDAAAQSLDEVAITVGGKRFRFWTDVTITRSADTVSTVSFRAPFEVDNADFRAMFRPFSYAPATVTVGGGRLFTGVLLLTPPVNTPNRRTIVVPAYGKPGVLIDCGLPASTQVEWDGMNLFQLAQEVCAPFGLTVKGEGDPGAVFDFVSISTEKKVFSFLAELARFRKFVLRDNEAGDLVIGQSAPAGSPVARLVQGEPPLHSVTPSARPQEYYSHVTGTLPALISFAGAQYTVVNSRLQGVIRPLKFAVPDILGVGTQAAVEAKVGRMFAHAITYTIEVVGWRDPQANLWAPNTTVTVLAPGAMIYTEYEFYVRSVTFRASKKARTATLSLVLPGAFEGKIPEFLPWDG